MISEQEYLKAIDDARGNISAIARSYGLSRGTVYSAINNSDILKKALDEARNSKIDILEDVAYNEAVNGNTALLIFLLKTQGKDRGYIERQEIAHDGDLNIHVRFGDDDQTTD